MTTIAVTISTFFLFRCFGSHDPTQVSSRPGANQYMRRGWNLSDVRVIYATVFCTCGRHLHELVIGSLRPSAFSLALSKGDN